MKPKLWFGWWGASDKGWLMTPNGHRVAWLPFGLNSKVKAVLDSFSHFGGCGIGGR